MVKEVNYVVVPSLISPDKMIYAGIMIKDKRNRGIWKTRCDVTGMVNNAFLEYFVAKAKEDSKKEIGMEYEWYDVNGYEVKLTLKKIIKLNEGMSSSLSEEDDSLKEGTNGNL